MKPNPISRRNFLAASAAFGAVSLVPRHVIAGGAEAPASERLNIALVGAGGMGAGDIRSVKMENVVALCDVDQTALDRNAKDFPKAKLHTDFRKMFDTQKEIDAVMVATPDHNHAVVSIMAMKLGKHVHCQKPLTHSVYEARMMAKVARESKVATQMGNQGQASEDARLICEMIWSGAVGTVREVHAGSNRIPAISPRGIRRPKETPSVPGTLNWDLWLGPAPERPYHPTYHPFAWRGWWDFGTGVLGDIGCHQLSAVFKALKLGQGTWPLNACPMDGGALALPYTAWRREKTVYLCRPREAEIAIGEGKDPALAVDAAGNPVIAWTQGQSIMMQIGPSGKPSTLAQGGYAQLIRMHESILAVWETSDETGSLDYALLS